MPVDAVTAAFHDWGRANGFTRKGTTLYRDQPETLAVVNLQGSQWGGRRYVNVALWLKAVAQASQPPEPKCHIRTRFDELLPDIGRLERVLRDDSGMAEAERASELRALLETYLTPVLAATGSLAELRENRPGFLDRFLLSRDALRLLGDGR
jgi:hypothetical protein